MPPSIPTPPTTSASDRRVTFGKIPTISGHRVLLYGPGGIGKTTLSNLAPGPVAYFDLDESLSRLRLSPEPLAVPCESWQSLRESLQSSGWDSVKTIVIDSVTRAEEMCATHTLATVKNDKGQYVHRIEDYGYGKGYQFIFDTFLPLMSDLDRHCRSGRNVILIAHECVTTVPNPNGEDWMRYEPRLQCPNSGKAAVRLRLKEWADHVLFLGYDVAVDKDGKGKGSGTRTLYPCELPFCMAKSRTTQTPLVVEDGKTLWANIIK